MKLLYTIAAAFLSTAAIAQIPNYSFENWTSMGSYENPDQWGTLNNTTAALGVYTVEKATPGNPGSFYMKITSKTAGPGVAPGIAVCGVLDSLTMQPKSGFAFNQRPANFTGKWQHMIFGNSQGRITVTLTRWDAASSTRETVAAASLTLSGMAMSWANFSIPFVYQTGNNPDTCIIFLAASGANPTNNDYLWVDDLGFSGSVAGVQEAASVLTGFNVFPNPSNEQLVLDLDFATPQQTVIELTDLSGRTVLSQNAGMLNGTVKVTLDLTAVAKGSYLVRIVTAAGTETKQIVIE